MVNASLHFVHFVSRFVFFTSNVLKNHILFTSDIGQRSLSVRFIIFLNIIYYHSYHILINYLLKLDSYT